MAESELDQENGDTESPALDEALSANNALFSERLRELDEKYRKRWKVSSRRWQAYTRERQVILTGGGWMGGMMKTKAVNPDCVEEWHITLWLEERERMEPMSDDAFAAFQESPEGQVLNAKILKDAHSKCGGCP